MSLRSNEVRRLLFIGFAGGVGFCTFVLYMAFLGYVSVMAADANTDGCIKTTGTEKCQSIGGKHANK